MEVGSLFCGAGGFDLGFINKGHKISWAIDNDKDCIETYKANIGTEAILADVKNVDFKSLSSADLIIGGFPCQGFSMANSHRHGGDERNLLYREFVRAVDEQKPKFFLAENVRGILSLDKGEAIKTIVKDFSNVGFDVEYRVFNAKFFGVPQSRVRVLIWGVRKDVVVERNWIAEDKNRPLISVGEALVDIPEPDTAHHLKNHVGSKYKITNRNFIGCRTTDPGKPSPTIIARGNGKGGVNAIQHPNNHRRMTVRECALIQTFPIDFEFYGSMSSAYRQIGNAVPVKFAEAIAQKFKGL